MFSITNTAHSGSFLNIFLWFQFHYRLLKFYFISYVCMYVCVLFACMSMHHRSQKALGPLGLALQMDISLHVGAGNQSWVF